MSIWWILLLGSVIGYLAAVLVLCWLEKRQAMRETDFDALEIEDSVHGKRVVSKRKGDASDDN
ncbi:MAG: hypothetical protein V3S69_00955 [Dehalococcoidales bacterium]